MRIQGGSRRQEEDCRLGNRGMVTGKNNGAILIIYCSYKSI
jgi:hypothetical protein